MWPGWTAVHPRACGEHASLAAQPRQQPGSSPRLRGTRALDHGRPEAHRFIPAPAGNTWPTPAAPRTRSVHPRACGEHREAGRDDAVMHGSSPRLRGTRPPLHRRILRSRFIPAPAGNTSIQKPACGRLPVHPRACGEHWRGEGGVDGCDGSSPRLRGTHADMAVIDRPPRFIPAPAGNTVCGDQGQRNNSVHPRACGEHAGAIQYVAGGDGSSPRLRGTLSRASCVRAPGRFIPAPAGNTSATASRAGVPTVHPRACGEHAAWNGRHQAAPGSSPRLRGTLGGKPRGQD